MDHAVTVRAKQPKITNFRLVARFQRVDGLGVMAFDEAFAVVPISLAEVKPTGLTSQSTERSECASLLGLDQCRVALVAPVHRGNNPALLRLLNPIPGYVRDGFSVLRISERLPNGLCHFVATLGIGGKCVPHFLLRLAAPRQPALAGAR